MILKPALAAMLATGLVVPEAPKLVFPKPATIKQERGKLPQGLLLGMPLTMGMLAKKATASFPVIETTATTNYTTNSSTYTINLPSGIVSGDILFLAVSWRDEARNFTSLSQTWTLLDEGNTSRGKFRVMWRIANGTEGSTTTLTLSGGASGSAAAAYRISGGQSVEGATPIVGTSGNLNPPSETPSWGAANTLWIAFLWAARTDNAVSGYPANYGLGQINAYPGTVGPETQQIALAARQLNASTEDPGAFTLTGADHTGVNTYAVEPS